MFKKAVSVALALALAFGILATLVNAAGGLTATPTEATVLVDGKKVAFDAYNINGNNYFKLRDLAYTLNGTKKQFSVGWDGAKNAITLTSGESYVATGGEMAGKGSGAKTPKPTSSRIYKDGKEVQFTAYNIEDNNYFKLRDIGEAFDFGVDWDGASKTIAIDTSKGYTPEGTATTEKPTDPPTTQPPKNENIDSKLVGEWEYRQYVYATGRYTTHYVSFRADGTFISSTIGSGGPYGLVGNYTVANGWITLSNVVARRGATEESKVVLENWLKTYKVEYRFEITPEGNEYLNMCMILYENKPELPLDFGWARWTKK